MRKAIQLSTTAYYDEEGDAVLVTNAIADDGSLWEFIDTSEGWKRLPDLPQENQPDCNEKNCAYCENYQSCNLKNKQESDVFHSLEDFFKAVFKTQ